MVPAGKPVHSRRVKKLPAGAEYTQLRGGGYITIHRNAGKLRDTKEATIKVCGAVWFDEEDITNILYFSMIMDNYSVCYDTEGK